MIACGDDKGSLWLYNLAQYGKDGAPPTKGLIDPTIKLAWPELQDDHLVSRSRLRFIKLYYLQWGSEIWTSLDFEWSKRSWVANVWISMALFSNGQALAMLPTI